MKRILFTGIISLFFCSFSFGQCAIYACDNTGAFGAGFNNDNTPTTMQECKDMAYKLCKEKGGTDCTLLHETTKAGWCAIINGQKSDGRNFFQGIDGESSQSAAENTVRKKYKDGGGVDAENIKIYSWYSYSNVKY